MKRMDIDRGYRLGKRAMKKPHNPNHDVVSIQLHGIQIEDMDNLPKVETLLKTWNSATRCAFKRFKSMGLDGIVKSYGNPKRGFWAMDKDMGSPIRAAEMEVSGWLTKHGYDLDSTLLHNAVMSGFKSYRSFERQKSEWKTTKENPSFGDMEARSKKILDKEGFNLTRNPSMTVVGKSREGNPKFKVDMDNCHIDFTFHRKKIGFIFKSHRFSKKGLKNLSELVGFMSNGQLPVTMTLTEIDSKRGKFNLTFSYSTHEMSKLKKEHIHRKCSVVSGIWFNDEFVHHRVVNLDGNGHKVIHSKTYRIDEESGEKRCLKYIETLRFKGDRKMIKRLKEKISNKTLICAKDIVKRIFNVNRSYGVSEVYVESPKSLTKRKFNLSLISFDKSKISTGSGRPCFVSANKFMDMVKSQCSRNKMNLSKVNGSFIQLKAVLTAKTMSEAIGNACSDLIERGERGFNARLTDWAKLVNINPSMLDWVGHLLHNKRNRQARAEIRRAFQARAVEKAVRMVDNMHRLDVSVVRA